MSRTPHHPKGRVNGEWIYIVLVVSLNQSMSSVDNINLIYSQSFITFLWKEFSWQYLYVNVLLNMLQYWTTAMEKRTFDECLILFSLLVCLRNVDSKSLWFPRCPVYSIVNELFVLLPQGTCFKSKAMKNRQMFIYLYSFIFSACGTKFLGTNQRRNIPESDNVPQQYCI